MIDSGNGVRDGAIDRVSIPIREDNGSIIDRASIFIREGSSGSIIGALIPFSNSSNHNNNVFNSDGRLFDSNNTTTMIDDCSSDSGSSDWKYDVIVD